MKRMGAAIPDDGLPTDAGWCQIIFSAPPFESENIRPTSPLQLVEQVTPDMLSKERKDQLSVENFANNTNDIEACAKAARREPLRRIAVNAVPVLENSSGLYR